MRNQRIKGFAAAVLALSLIAACSDDKKTTSTTAPVACATTTPVKLQLQWVTQAQFAGYYAALDQGFYCAL